MGRQGRSKSRKPDGRHDKAIAALGRGATQAEAAKAAGVRAETICRWLADPEHPVSVGLEEIARRTVRHAERELRHATKSAVRALVGIAQDEDMPPAARVAAAREILSRGGLSATDKQEVSVTSKADPKEAVSRLVEAIREGRGDPDGAD